MPCTFGAGALGLLKYYICNGNLTTYLYRAETSFSSIAGLSGSGVLNLGTASLNISILTLRVPIVFLVALIYDALLVLLIGPDLILIPFELPLALLDQAE